MKRTIFAILFLAFLLAACNPTAMVMSAQHPRLNACDMNTAQMILNDYHGETVGDIDGWLDNQMSRYTCIAAK